PRYAGEDLVFKKSKTYLQQSCKFSDIVNGKKAKKNSMLYMASVQTDGKHSCGGFLIHPSYVFTASHCDKSKAYSNLKRYKVQNKHKHPSFKDVKTVNDIELLKENMVNDLLETDVLTINSSICQTMWKEVRVKLPSNVLCAGVSRPKGDSGGPLVCSGTAVRIVSFNLSQNCDYPNFPNVYTEIFKYKDWIKEVIRGGKMCQNA
uniref:Peptidase S1 domain-containing protein n=1 Tax=Cyprinus carpio TaxID=7962 RepID=A0A8C1X2R4_CYPCA